MTSENTSFAVLVNCRKSMCTLAQLGEILITSTYLCVKGMLTFLKTHANGRREGDVVAWTRLKTVSMTSVHAQSASALLFGGLAPVGLQAHYVPFCNALVVPALSKEVNAPYAYVKTNVALIKKKLRSFEHREKNHYIKTYSCVRFLLLAKTIFGRVVNLLSPRSLQKTFEKVLLLLRL